MSHLNSATIVVVLLLVFTRFGHASTITLKNVNQTSSYIFNQLSNGTQLLSSSVFEEFYNCTTRPDQCEEFSDFMNVAHVMGTSHSCDTKICKTLNKCSSSSEVMSLLRSQSNGITLEDFEVLLPVILLQTEYCRYPVKDLDVKHRKPTSSEVWGYGILFVTLISLCSLAGVSVLPVITKDYYQKVLTMLIGLAVGSLVSSALFHLLPQAFNLAAMEGGSHDYLFMSLMVLCGIWAFFMIETAIKFFSIMYQRKQKSGLSGSVSAQGFVGNLVSPNQSVDNYGVMKYDYRKDTDTDVSSKPTADGMLTSEVASESNGISTATCQVQDPQIIFQSQEQAIKASFGHDQKPEKVHHSHEVHFRQGEDSVISTVAYMIIFGDGFHNFIDGVSIGAAFQQSILTGVSISLAVMCEELPHELGDFAVLLNSGMTMKQALFYNFLSATTCYLGLVVGILLGEFTESSRYIFALAAGMFLYISLVDMLPEMNETSEKATRSGKCEAVKVLILQNIGMFIGVFSLFFLAYYQDSLMLE